VSEEEVAEKIFTRT